MHRIKLVIASVLLVTGTVRTVAQQPPAASVTPAGTTTRAATKPSPRLLPGTKGNIFTTIQGNVLNSSNGALPNGVMRLRDARFGRIVDQTVSDRAGMFAFRTLEPGSYIIELMGADNQSVLAASQIIHVNAGDAVTAVVKLPFRVPPFAGVLGDGRSSAAVITAEAAASGVLGAVVTGQPASDRPIR